MYQRLTYYLRTLQDSPKCQIDEAWLLFAEDRRGGLAISH